MSLFVLEKFRSSSGIDLSWKIECDNLTETDYECIVKNALRCIPNFSEVIPVPTGGNKLVKYFEPYCICGHPPLIVDDVYTTGANIHRIATSLPRRQEWNGFVIFSRGFLPSNVISMFDVNPLCAL